MSDIARIIADAFRARGLDPKVGLRIAQIESGLNPNARNPKSSAGGLFQFIDGTAAQYGLRNRFDPVEAAAAAAKLTADNAGTLSRALGRAPDGAELYLAHQQGAGGALGILRDPKGPARGANFDLNGGVGQTKGAFADAWRRKFEGGPAMVLPDVAAGPEPAPQPAPQAPQGNRPLGDVFTGIAEQLSPMSLEAPKPAQPRPAVQRRPGPRYVGSDVAF